MKSKWELLVLDAAPPVKNLVSLTTGDIDGDGELEIIAGEHDPFWPYRNQCRLYVYKRSNQQATAWKRYTLDNRFEHHDGTKVIQLEPRKLGIISHGWKDNIYVNLWMVKD